MSGQRSVQRATNDRLWSRADLVRRYRNTALRPVEEALLERHRERLSGRVLDIGCGAGRLTSYLALIADDLLAIDVSPHMLEAVAEHYPQIHTEQRDMRELDAYPPDRFSAVVASFAVADVLDEDERGAFLDAVAQILEPGGTLVLSGHNLAAEKGITSPLRPALNKPKQLVARVLYGRRWRQNRARLLPHERRGDGFAILNDVAHDFDGLHYYTDRAHQAQQLAAHGYELIECLDLDGATVPPGEDAPRSSELHYVAVNRRS